MQQGDCYLFDCALNRDIKILNTNTYSYVLKWLYRKKFITEGEIHDGKNRKFYN